MEMSFDETVIISVLLCQNRLQNLFPCVSSPYYASHFQSIPHRYYYNIAPFIVILGHLLGLAY